MMNSFSNRNYYRDFQLQRDAAMRDAEREHLAHLSNEPQVKNESTVPPPKPHMLHLRLPHLRLHIRHAVVFFLVIGMLAVGAPSLLAQDLADPGSSEPYDPALVNYRVGYYFQLQGNHERAVAEFTEVITRFPNWAGGYAARGDSYAELEQYDLAIADYTVALNLTPGFVSVMYMRGQAYQATGDSVLALADYQTAIELASDYPLPYWGMGNIYFEQGDTTEALACYQHYITLTGESPDAQVMARVMLLRG